MLTIVTCRQINREIEIGARERKHLLHRIHEKQIIQEKVELKSRVADYLKITN